METTDKDSIVSLHPSDLFIYNYLGPYSPRFSATEVPVAKTIEDSVEKSILYIYQWGTTKFKSLKFRGYDVVHILCNDIPDLTSCESLAECFYRVKVVGDLSKWQVHNVKDMSSMFARSQFNGDISKWQVHNVTDMRSMFSQSQFNGDISEWQVHNVRDMRCMFHGSRFSGDISKWAIDDLNILGIKITSPPLVYDTLELITTPIFNTSCPICSETTQLMVAKCHHVICLECHQQHTSKSNRCPLCRGILTIIGRIP